MINHTWVFEALNKHAHVLSHIASLFGVFFWDLAARFGIRGFTNIFDIKLGDFVVEFGGVFFVGRLL